MTAVDEEHSGVASGVNNAVSRTAALLAVAVFGFVLSGVFNSALDRRVADLTPETRRLVNNERPRLAAGTAAIVDERGRQDIRESFVDGFRAVAWIAAVLAIVSSL